MEEAGKNDVLEGVLFVSKYCSESRSDFFNLSKRYHDLRLFDGNSMPAAISSPSSNNPHNRLLARSALSRINAVAVGHAMCGLNSRVISAMDAAFIVKTAYLWRSFIADRRKRSGFETSYNLLLQLVLTIVGERAKNDSNGEWGIYKNWITELPGESPDNDDVSDGCNLAELDFIAETCSSCRSDILTLLSDEGATGYDEFIRHYGVTIEVSAINSLSASQSLLVRQALTRLKSIPVYMSAARGGSASTKSIEMLDRAEGAYLANTIYRWRHFVARMRDDYVFRNAYTQLVDMAGTIARRRLARHRGSSHWKTIQTWSAEAIDGMSRDDFGFLNNN